MHGGSRSRGELYQGSSGQKILKSVANQHLNLLTFAPDMVKWSKKDLRKLLEDKKPPEEN